MTRCRLLAPVLGDSPPIEGRGLYPLPLRDSTEGGLDDVAGAVGVLSPNGIMEAAPL